MLSCKWLCAVVSVGIVLNSSGAALAEELQMNVVEAPLVEKYLVEGKLAAGEAALQTKLRGSSNDQIRFGLGMLQFLQAVEGLSQDLYKYGLRQPFSRDVIRSPLQFAIPLNPSPETLSYSRAREIVEKFRCKLAQSDATLRTITDPDVMLPLHFGMIRMDLNGDGRADEDETLWKLYAALSGNSNVNPDSSRNFYIKFDRGDVHWLRGYCNLLMGVCQTYLAYDTSETFNLTAHMFFAKVDSPYKFLSEGKRVYNVGIADVDLADVVAFFHSIRWPVVEAHRMEQALHNFEEVVAQSRETWKWIMAETDDDHEWLPNPRQTGVIPNVRVTQEMVDAWAALMSDGGDLLSGETLIPFWRGERGYGVNVRKVFLEPRTFDLVLWLQGAAAGSYLEKGRTTTIAIWRLQQSAFGSQFPGFALWFN